MSTRSQNRQGRQPKLQLFDSRYAVEVWDPRTPNLGLSSTPETVSTPRSDGSCSEAATEASTEGVLSITSSRNDELTTSHLSSLISTVNHPPLRFKYHKRPVFDPDTPSTYARFFSHYEIFILGPSFTLSFRNSIKKLYNCSPSILHDILYELETALPTVPNGSGVEDVDFSTGCTSLQDLRMLNPECEEHAFAIVGLGQVLAAFDLMTECTGAEAILRSSLISVKGWVGRLLEDELCASVVIGAVFWDTVRCVMRGDVPVVKYESGKGEVHRLAGICTSLLPILYDLCVVHEAVLGKRDDGGVADLSAFETVQERVRAWQPGCPADFTTTFSHQEIVKMEAQATLYRLAALLVCHRIIHPYGTGDDVALNIAAIIVQCFEKAREELGGIAKLNLVCFPLLLAVLEVDDMSKDIWQNISLSATASAWTAKAQVFIEYVWQERRTGSSMFLSDLIREGPAFVIIP